MKLLYDFCHYRLSFLHTSVALFNVLWSPAFHPYLYIFVFVFVSFLCLYLWHLDTAATVNELLTDCLFARTQCQSAFSIIYHPVIICISPVFVPVFVPLFVPVFVPIFITVFCPYLWHLHTIPKSSKGSQIIDGLSFCENTMRVDLFNHSPCHHWQCHHHCMTLTFLRVCFQVCQWGCIITLVTFVWFCLFARERCHHALSRSFGALQTQ